MNELSVTKTPERTIISFSALGLKHVYIAGKYTYSSAQTKLEKHLHPGIIEICYCDKGQQVYEVDQKEYRLKGGDVFITFPNEFHSTAEYPEDKGVLYWLQIKVPKNKESFLGYNTEFGKILSDSILNIPDRHFKGVESMKKILEEIILLGQQGGDKLNSLMIYNLVTNFLLITAKCAQANYAQPHKNERIESIKTFIKENLYNDLSIEILAAQQCISESHFKSWFKKEIGITPIDYILRERIERAKEMLQQNRLINITQVAFQLNFSSSQYFATVFKKYTGITPAEFRNMDKLKVDI